MPKSMTQDEALACMALLAMHGGNVSKAALAVGMSRNTLQSQKERALSIVGVSDVSSTDDPVVPQADPLPNRLPPIEDLIAQRKSAFEHRKAHADAVRWRKFHVPHKGPYALMFFGDPHIDDDGHDVSLFESHAELAASTTGLYAINIGDTTNNWVGRLARLWANQNASADVTKALVKHYLADSGIPWFLWLHGNHDMWDGPIGREVFERYRPHYVSMHDWQAKITLVAPNGHELRLWAAHNFKGTSIWNPLHGPLRASQMADWAHLYVAGHHHTWGQMQYENADRRFVANVSRVRGYKFMDEYADINGFSEQSYGASMVAIVDPDADKLNAVTCFHDPFEGVDYLAFKRRKLG